MKQPYRSRRNTRSIRNRNLLFSAIILVLLSFVASFFSLHIYWQADFMSRLAMRLSQGQTEFANTQNASPNDWREKADLSSSFDSHIFATPGRVNFIASPTTSADQGARQILLDKLLKRDKLRNIDALPSTPLAILSEKIDRAGNAFARKKVIALLPGEEVSFDSAAFANAAPRLTLRCLGATADRLDIPGKLTLIRPTGPSEIVSISPRGDFTTLHLAPMGHNRLQWESAAPGLLIISGELQQQNAKPGLLVISIDSLIQGSPALPNTLAALKSQGFLLKSQMPFWPVSTAPERNLRQPFSASLALQEESVPTIAHQANMRSYRIFFTPKNRSTHANIDFDTEIEIVRHQELRNGMSQILSRIDTENFKGSLVNISITMPPAEMGFTWKSALNSNYPLYGWFFSAWVGRIISPMQTLKYKAEEKALQIDEALSALFRTTGRENLDKVIIHIQDAQRQSPEENPLTYLPVRPGELLIASLPGSPTTDISTQHDLPGTLAALITNSNFPPVSTTASIALPRESIFVSDKVWMSLPTDANAGSQWNYVPLANRVGFLSEVRQVQSRKSQRTLKIQTNGMPSDWNLSVLGVPPNAKCEGAKFVLSTYTDKPNVPNIQFRHEGGQNATTVHCTWLSNKTDTFSLIAYRNGKALPPEEISVGAYALRGKADLDKPEQMQLDAKGEFAPAMVPATMVAESPLWLWLEDFTPGFGGEP